jgi:hypothetical protein
MVRSAHRLKVVIAIKNSMANECTDCSASVSLSLCQSATNHAGHEESDGDCAYAPFVITEQVTIQGGYLKHPAVVCCQRVNGDCFVLVDQCHWVCKAVVGRGRGRSPLKDTQTLHKLRDCAKRQLMQALTLSALAEDPLCIIDCADSDGRLLETPVKRRRPMSQTFSPTVVYVAAVDVAPPGFVGLDGIHLALYCANRLHTSIGVYVRDQQVPLVLNFLRYELQR